MMELAGNETKAGLDNFFPTSRDLLAMLRVGTIQKRQAESADRLID
jgi:hypothetical protein